MFPSINDADAAISYALANLEPFEAFDFLTAWKNQEDLTPWFRATETDSRAGRGDWSGHEATA